MALQTQPYKGARDFYPEDFRVRDFMFNKIRTVVKKYGYEEYDAPLLEPLDLYMAKTGEEIVNEQTYSFVDRGGRQVAIRPEMTPTVSRMVASKRQELAYPLRWFSIPNLWRYERPQRGRLREHWQLNVDLFGDENINAEHELILLGSDLLKSFGAKSPMFEIRVNNREFINHLFESYFGLNPTQSHTLSKLIDRMDKIERAVFEADVDALCTPSQKEAGLSDRILQILSIKTIAELPEELRAHDSIFKITSLINWLRSSGVDNVRFDITLMRGFDYYTGVVFEFFDLDPENNRAMFGGGRYDGLVGLFGVEPVPVVGFGMGDVTLQNFLTSHNLLPKINSEIDLIIITVGDVYERSQPLLKDLRRMGLNIFVDATDRKIANKIKNADKHGVKFVMFVGENELNEGQYPVKNLETGHEQKHSPERLVSIIKDFRN